jgi:hypothetical protein
MTADEVADLSARIDLERCALTGLPSSITQSIVEGLQPQDLDEDNSPAYILQVVEEDSMFERLACGARVIGRKCLTGAKASSWHTWDIHTTGCTLGGDGDT